MLFLDIAGQPINYGRFILFHQVCDIIYTSKFMSNPVATDDCSQNRSKYYALVTTNVATDIVIMALPIPLLWKLQVNLRKKLGFSLIFCGGIFIVVCTLLRCIICLTTPERLDLGLSWSIRETVCYTARVEE